MILLDEILLDGGRFYAETNPDYWIVEPWNAISSLTFFAPVFYWYHKLKNRFFEYPFLTYCMPLMFLGGLGSTLYHAFRASSFLETLDVLPILILTASLSIFLWIKILPHWWYIFLLIIPYFLLRQLVFSHIPSGYTTNLDYLMRGITMFLPAYLLLKKMNYRDAYLLGMVVFFFTLALCFRYLDQTLAFWMYMGSHWLWHIFTSAGSFYLAEFLYRVEGGQKDFKVIR